MVDFKHIIVICGNYGSGKTTVSLNLAEKFANMGKSVNLVDMDVVNPYFRSSDYAKRIANPNIKVFGPSYAGTNLDTPSFGPEISGALEGDCDYVIVDVGGDDAGATALGCYSDIINSADYDMLYVVNQNREDVETPKLAVEILSEIENACHLKCTGVINNTHLCGLSTAEMIASSAEYAANTAKLINVPLVFTSFNKELKVENINNPLAMDIIVTPPWANNQQ